MAATSSRSSLNRRVTLAATLSAVAGSLVATVVAIASVDWLIANHADRRLVAQLGTLAGELEEEAAQQDDSVQETLDDENSEIVASGIRLAVYEGHAVVAGDPWVPRVKPDRCLTRGELGNRIRACGKAYRHAVLVAAERRDESMLYSVYLAAGLTALVVAGGIGALASARTTRWALQPLSRLTEDVAGVAPSQPDARAFEAPVGVTEVDAIRQALHQVLNSLREHLTRLERFTADAAHELKTPLTLLRGELELLAEDADDDTTSARLLRAAQRAAELSDLTDSLLSLALPERDLTPGFLPVALDEVIADTLSGLPSDQARRVRHGTTAEGLVYGDPALLRVLAKNAIDNALKFSKGSIDVLVTENADTVTLTVRDVGPGVSEALRMRVFEPFFRIQPEATPGYGLGLSIVGHIARVHRGTVAFEDVDQGSELSIRLPMWTQE